MCVCYAGARGGQKRVSSTLELKFQDVVNHLTWALETKLVSSWRTASSLDRWAISPVPTRTISWLHCLQSPLMTSLMVGFKRSSEVKIIPAMVSLQCHQLLLVWSSSAFCVPVKPSQQGRVLSKLMRYTETCDRFRWSLSTQKPQFFSRMMPDL